MLGSIEFDGKLSSLCMFIFKVWSLGFRGFYNHGSDDKESACNAGLIPGSGSPEEGNGHPLQYSSLENFMDRGALVGYSPWDCKELDMTE